MQGKVKWFNSAKGYGFIGPRNGENGGKDIFVHYSGIEMDGYKELKENDEVEFEIEAGAKGKRQATHVRRVEG